MPSLPYKRVVIIGSTSSGKSTLAQQLADRFGYDYIELDALHWESGWQAAKLEVFRERVRDRIQAPAWIVAGNYHIVRDMIWPQAEAIIWLDYPFFIVLWRLTRRTITRWWTRELLWGTNREPFWVHFKLWSQDSLFHWLVKTHWRRKRETPLLLFEPEHRHLNLIHFTHPRETEQWQNKLSKTQ